MKKTIIILVSIFVAVIAILLGLYFYGLTAVSKNSDVVLFNIEAGKSKVEIVDELKEAGLIRSKISLYVYIALNKDLNLQAGRYELSKDMSATDIINKINNGEILESKNTFTLTFIEGKRLVDYAKVIADAINITKEEVMAVLSDEVYMQELINNYWFITDEILKDNIYYPLEGYLFASTYEFYNNSTVKDIVKVMLDTLDSKLSSYKENINESQYSVHDYITLASVVELEEASSDDRAGVAGVFYNRLKAGDSLGSDVTTYYAFQKDFSQELTMSELNNCNNGYNTRGGCNIGKLPVGPICSPSMASLIAVIEPVVHDYYFFVADKNNKTYFMKTYSEHNAKISELKSAGLWYEY